MRMITINQDMQSWSSSAVVGIRFSGVLRRLEVEKQRKIFLKNQFLHHPEAWLGCYMFPNPVTCISEILGASDCVACVCDVLDYLGLMTCWSYQQYRVFFHEYLQSKILTAYLFNKLIHQQSFISFMYKQSWYMCEIIL